MRYGNGRTAWLIARQCYLGLLCFALVAVGRMTPVHPHHLAAASLLVNSTEDAPDGNPGDGRCETAAGTGICTLRAAIMEANANQDADVITVPAGTYRLNRPHDPDDEFAIYGDLDLTNHVAIRGAGTVATVIDGAGATRIFDIAGPVHAEISNLTIRNGSDGDGAAVRNAGTLTLINVAITANSARASGGGILNSGVLSVKGGGFAGNFAGRGGAIANLGSLTVTGARFDGNSVWRYGGALTNDPDSFMTLAQVIVTRNIGGFCCGGIANGGTLTITASTISENRSEFGGGVTNNHRHAAAVINSSTISGNEATDGGGGIVNQGTLTLTNVTISGNRAGRNGGGLYNGVFDGAPSSSSLYNVTFAGNAAPNGGALYNDERAGVQLRNTILAGASGAATCAGALTSLGHNLDSGTSCGLRAAGDIADADPKLGPLDENGGGMRTHALRPDSAAVDAGDNAGCPSHDQRGVPRPQRAACDIGAFELQGPSPGAAMWSERPPASPQVSEPAACPPPGSWRLLYWAGSDGASIADAMAICRAADRSWVSRQGRWLGYAPDTPAASDQWSLVRGEAHFLHGR